MPALVLVTALAADRAGPGCCARLAKQAAAPLCERQRTWTCHVASEDIQLASVARVSGLPEPISAWSSGPITVVLEGYLAEDAPGAGPAKMAGYVAQLYQQQGESAIEKLRGSFVIVVIDCQAGTVELWTDRAGTRPLFMSVLDGVLVVAPEPKCFRALPGVQCDLVPGSLAAMTLNGALLDEHTYYRGVQLIGPARHIAVRRSRLQVARYWQRVFSDDPHSHAPTATEVADCICAATRRHLARFRRPILALSGGLDSRLLLAACRRNGTPFSVVTWGFDHVDTAGSDYQVAQQLSQRAGVEHRLLPLDVDTLPQHAERVVYLTDGLTGHLGNYTTAEAVARALSTEHDAVVRGDQAFADYPIARTRPRALAMTGVNIGKRLWLLRFLLRRDVRGAVLRDYGRQWQELLDSIPARVPVTDVADAVFLQTRLPRVIASQWPVLRSHLEVVNPLLDDDVVDLVRCCRPAERVDNRYIADCAQAAFPDEFSIPVSSVHSRASWRTRFPKLGVLQRYLVETLLDPLPGFDAWFSRTAIRAWLEYALAEGARAPWPVDSEAWRRGAARLGAVLLRPTFKERVVLNLVTLKLWFKQFA